MTQQHIDTNTGFKKNTIKTFHPANLIAEEFHDDSVSKFAVTIGKPIEMVYSFWRKLSNLSSFMKDLKQVTEQSKTDSHWVVELKNGLTAEWDAEIIAETENEMIAWKSVDGSDIETRGSVWFTKAPSNLGTVVSLLMQYKIPGGKLTEFAAKLTGEDGETLLQINLHRLKALLETGEIPTIEGQSSGRGEDLPSDNVKH